MSNFGAQGDRQVGELASRQHGVVSVVQLRHAGLDKYAVYRRIRSGRLCPLHRGVYAVGHRGSSDESRWMAAVLACGDGAVLSHRDAAALWKLLPAPRGPIDISTSARSGRRRRPGIRLHRCTSLDQAATTRRLGIPVTRPARTVADLRAVASAKELRRAIRQAEVLGLAIGAGMNPDRTRSELEVQFLQLCARHDLPMPEVNVRIGSLRVDFLWREQAVVAETDGYRYHRGRAAFEDDRDRDLTLRALGYEVIRLSYRQVSEEPERIAGVLGQALRAGRARWQRID